MAGSGQIDMGNKEGGKNNGHDKVNDGYYHQTADKSDEIRKVDGIQVKNAANQKERHHQKHKLKIGHLLQGIKLLIKTWGIGVGFVLEYPVCIKSGLNDYPFGDISPVGQVVSNPQGDQVIEEPEEKSSHHYQSKTVMDGYCILEASEYVNPLRPMYLSTG